MSVLWAGLSRRERTSGMSSRTLLFPCPPTCPVGTGLQTLCCSLGCAARCWHTLRLCSQMLAHSKAPFLPQNQAMGSLSPLSPEGAAPPGHSRAGGGSVWEGPLGELQHTGGADLCPCTQAAARGKAEWPHRACDVSHSEPDGEQPRPGGHRLQRSLRQGILSSLGSSTPSPVGLATPHSLLLKAEPRFCFHLCM